MDNKKHNSFCAICGKSYYYCNSCKDTAHLYPYKILTDTSEHYKVFMIIRGYDNGLYTKEETKEKLNNVDISDLETYKENIRDIIKDILKVDNKVEVVEKKEIIEEKNNVEEINHELENGNIISTVNTTTKTYRPYRIRKEKNNKQS